MTTIHDVAKRLNVSIATVSRALDGYGDISDQTRRRIIDAAAEMGYSPNRAARQLRRQKSETIGFILPASAKRFDEAFYTEFISGLGEALSEQNYDLLVANATTDNQENQLYQKWINSQKVDGVILDRLRHHDWRVNYLISEKVPFSALEKSLDPGDYPYIHIQAENGYLELLKHFKFRGFSRPAFIGGDLSFVRSMENLRCFTLAAEKNGLELTPDLITQTSLMNSNGGYETANRLLSRPDPPDVIVCINDDVAFGVLHAANQRGLQIGTQLGVAGFDGVQDARHTEPPLTTLDIPVPEIAGRLAQMLLQAIQGQVQAATRGAEGALGEVDAPFGEDRSAHKQGTDLDRVVAPGQSGRRPFQPRRISDADEVGRTGAGVEADPGSGTGGVRPVRHDPPEHLRERAVDPGADVRDAAPGGALLRGADVGRRGIRRIGGLGSPRGNRGRAPGPG